MAELGRIPGLVEIQSLPSSPRGGTVSLRDTCLISNYGVEVFLLAADSLGIDQKGNDLFMEKERGTQSSP